MVPDHFTRKAGFLALLLVILGSAFALSSDAQSQRDQAWTVLQSALSDSKPETRAIAIRALTVVTSDPKAVAAAEKALADQDPDVRAAAAGALGILKAKSSIPKLTAALKDQQGSVVMAAAHALVLLGSEKGYSVYYALVTGQRKSGQGIVGSEEKEMDEALRHPDQLASEAFEQGIGYVPYGGVAMGVFQHFHDSGKSEALVKAAAVKMLAKDPDSRSGQALVGATSDKEWVVRAAAYDALARRGDRSLLSAAANGMNDSEKTVQLMSAAAAVQLSAPRAEGK